jgi:hypothetical protein
MLGRDLCLQDVVLTPVASWTSTLKAQLRNLHNTWVETTESGCRMDAIAMWVRRDIWPCTISTTAFTGTVR